MEASFLLCDVSLPLQVTVVIYNIHGMPIAITQVPQVLIPLINDLFPANNMYGAKKASANSMVWGYPRREQFSFDQMNINISLKTRYLRNRVSGNIAISHCLL